MEDNNKSIQLINTIHRLEKQQEHATANNIEPLKKLIHQKINEAKQALIADTVQQRNNKIQPRAGVKGTQLV